ncbi:hypothetical protein B484DRAFT_478253 [Ochromonadaceae sp. CCMP2298]|nr:hypothetical protein B484DRAFT_478253 [Ochromonadaceae sp. CCMP2298]|mmetsp:Transcript_12266/g.27320  ORF Transcript_12266/g.27320 Transcript_12266/m.27320 type:complete len:247 (-) Transcript_12266:353-1093(-)|eukprot:CAMPEP_0173188194 /NCGR_PEP_ID=MMETSP1141-20130122/11129_1 /TAXON_ID=483371 /ORGANISM="non described non described, Strain CCMP2298" /LENGTH=246 /DNA_ID=CAMNT_0014112115 /DNA_START=134 /DNA_END=874 /DNA_ORIENTATION=-
MADKSTAEELRQQEDYNDEDDDNLDEIEKELSRAGLGAPAGNSADFEDFLDQAADEPAPSPSGRPIRSGVVPAAAMPQQNGKLSSFAGEFWFPECRNCPCCKGFKHGCRCCQGGVDTCCNPACVDGAFADQVSAELATRTTTSTSSYSVSAPTSAPASASASAPSPPKAAQGDPNSFCKYECTPQGCRFGASCRFKHANPSAAPAYGMPGGYGGYAPPSPPGGSAKCIYFQRGNCQFGDGCRFSHQ